MTANVKEEAIDLDVLDNGGETKFGKIRIYVHNPKRATILKSLKRKGYWFKDAAAQTVYIDTQDRSLAQNFVDKNYGKGKYKVNSPR